MEQDTATVKNNTENTAQTDELTQQANATAKDDATKRNSTKAQIRLTALFLSSITFLFRPTYWNLTLLEKDQQALACQKENPDK